jgi:hypothetical protein
MRAVHADCPEMPDLWLIAADVQDQAARKGAKSVNGLFVDRVRKLRRAIEERRGAQVSPVELERYAELQVQLYRLAVSKGWSPRDVARAYEQARTHGFERLNPMVVEKLDRLGDHWPGTEAQG